MSVRGCPRTALRSGRCCSRSCRPTSRRLRSSRSTSRAAARNTLTSRTALGLELKRVRENGFAINNEELAYGLRSIAAPILTHDGVAAAAINLAVHSSMVSLEDLAARLSATLRRAAADISARLGYRP
jgi:IclR family transcriptional regulator, pca regulon regulatory protein